MELDVQSIERALSQRCKYCGEKLKPKEEPKAVSDHLIVRVLHCPDCNEAPFLRFSRTARSPVALH